MKLHEVTGKRILAVPLVRAKIERCKHLQELNNAGKKLQE